jgi:hypothetical protein
MGVADARCLVCDVVGERLLQLQESRLMVSPARASYQSRIGILTIRILLQSRSTSTFTRASKPASSPPTTQQPTRAFGPSCAEQPQVPSLRL